MGLETDTTQTEYPHIVQTPGMLGGEARIAGQRIRARDAMAARDRGGLTPEEIAATVYPTLTLAQVYAALAYYEAHRAATTEQARWWRADDWPAGSVNIGSSCAVTSTRGQPSQFESPAARDGRSLVIRL